MDLTVKAERLFEFTFASFFAEEGAHIRTGISERSVCARFAMKLQGNLKRRGLKGYYADAEYNRKQGGRVKTILDENAVTVTIVCDIVVHKRGATITDDNLIAIEAKRADRPKSEKDDDRNRLRALTKTSFDDVWSADGQTHPEHVCGYKVGYYIEFDHRTGKGILEQYKSGRKVTERLFQF